MAANPAGAAIARDLGVEITFTSWLVASSVPSLTALAVIPFLLYKVFPPGLKRTPEAPAAAGEELRSMGPMSRSEWITGITFIAMIAGWALSETLVIDRTAVAFLGLGILLLSGVFTLADLKRQGSALGIFIWFAVLYALSTSLNKYGFMSFVGGRLAAHLEGLSWPVVYTALIAIYVVIHYLFVSQTAHMLALYGIFLEVGIASGVPAGVMACMLLFATNFFAAVTPQGSSANVIFAGSGYLTQGEIYKHGGIVTFANTAIYLAVGTPWILLIGP
jgi:DASS family divalent anion:Na+ symporter